MNDHPRWPHLENLDRVLRDIPDYLTREHTIYTVTEKVHGFNARFGRAEDGTPWVGSRNQTVVEGDPSGWNRESLQGFVGFAADHVMAVPEGVTIYGEWAGRGIQKGIDYGDKAFYAFGWAEEDLRWFHGIVQWCERRGIRTVPILFTGSLPNDPLTLTFLQSIRTQKSALAEEDHEGVVISPWPPITDQYGHRIIAKYKAPKFEERAHAKREAPAPFDLASVQAFVDEYVTDTRLEHVLQQVAEELHGRFDGTMHEPRDIDPLDVLQTGSVIRAMAADIQREGGSDYEALSDADKKMLGKVASKATKALLEAARDAAMGEAA